MAKTRKKKRRETYVPFWTTQKEGGERFNLAHQKSIFWGKKEGKEKSGARLPRGEKGKKIF